MQSLTNPTATAVEGSRTTIRVAIGPAAHAGYAAAVERGDGTVVPIHAFPEGLVWSVHGREGELRRTLDSTPSLRWVQLPSAGIEDFVRADVLRDGMLVTSAKGAFAEPVAEHALTLALALLRRIPERARASQWGEQDGRSLHRLRTLIIGGGGVGSELARLLSIFDTMTTVIRRNVVPVPHAARTLGMEHLFDELPNADVVFLATALTPQTEGLISAVELEAMPKTSVLINVARGGLVVTDDLVDALHDGTIAGAAVDVTNPEPLPSGHPLWSAPNALITPHSADTVEMVERLLAERITENTRRAVAGRGLLGVVDNREGY